MDDKKDGDVVIVHLSDLHLRGKDDSDAKIVIKALIEDLEAERSKQTNDFDLIVFSGDLVHAGGISDQFSDAKTEFIDKLLAATDTPRSRFVSCPGNHDIDRNAARDEPWVENGLKQHLNTRLAINDFIDRHINVDIFGSLPSPLKRMQHFYRSVWAEPSADRIMQCPFVSVFSFETKGQTIGVAAFNTAWRATGEADDRDKGNLILGERVVDHALEHLKQVNIRLAVFHHPLSWLHPSDQAAVDGRLQAEFDFLLCGHIHQASPEVRRSPAGQAILSQGSSLYVSREYFNGYNIIRLQNAEEKAEIAIQEYSDQRRKFVSATRIVEGGHIDYPFACRGVRAVARLTKMLQVVKPVIKQLANEHISKLVSAGTQLDIEHHFVCPSLSALSQASAQIDDAIFQKEPESNLLESALASLKSIAIIGRPESGKTSLAHHIATVVANGLADSSRLPLICKFSELRLGERSFWRLVRSYATEISDGSITREFVESEQVFVIVDDVNLFDEARIEILQAFVKARTNVRWALIVGSPATLVNVDALAHKYFSEFDIYTIRELSRRAIRALSANWIKSKTDDDDAEELYRNVMEQIRRTGLPRSGYIISLILWTMRNKSRGELLNEAVLIQNIIDYMLGRMDYTGALRSEFDFTSKTAVLQYLAFHFKEKGEVQKKNDVIKYVVELLKRKALDYDAADIVTGFIECGIMVKMSDEISFRYKRFQEFFVAGYIRDNVESLVEIKKGDNWIGYARDLDIYTSRFRHEHSLLEFAKSTLKSIDIPDPALSLAEAKDYLAAGLDPTFTLIQLRRMRKQKMTASRIDSLMDITDQRLVQKRQMEVRQQSTTGVAAPSTLYMRFYLALEMYSQFVRNLEFVDRDIKRNHLLESLAGWEKSLRGTLSTVKQGMDELKEDIPKSGLITAEFTEEKIKELIGFIESYFKGMIPTVASTLAYQNLGSEKLIDLIEEIAHDGSNSAFRRLLCGFILLELDALSGFNMIESLSDEITEKWFVHIVTQRLFQYYSTRPLSSSLRGRFEELVSKLEIRLRGRKPQAKDQVLVELKKHVFLEKRKQRASGSALQEKAVSKQGGAPR